MPLCFHYLSWMNVTVFPWSFTNVCLRVSLIYHGSTIWKYASRFFDPSWCMPQSFLDLSWMSAIVFPWSSMDIKCILSFMYVIVFCVIYYTEDVCMLFLWSMMYAYFMFTSSILAAWVSSWMYTIVILWCMMDVCYSISLIYLGCMPQRFFYLWWMYALTFPWSIMDMLQVIFFISVYFNFNWLLFFFF